MGGTVIRVDLFLFKTVYNIANSYQSNNKKKYSHDLLCNKNNKLFWSIKVIYYFQVDWMYSSLLNFKLLYVYI